MALLVVTGHIIQLLSMNVILRLLKAVDFVVVTVVVLVLVVGTGHIIFSCGQ